MYIVAIAWIYVTLLMAVTETNITAAILTFCLYGLAPLALLLWLFGTPKRRHAALHRAAESSLPTLPASLPASDPDTVPPLVDRHFGEPDGDNAKSDQ